MKRVESPQIQDKEPEILTIAEIRHLFRANEKIDPEICGLLALGAFAGNCLYRHYLGIANQKDAEQYFEIRPLE